MSETIDVAFAVSRADIAAILPYVEPAWRGFLTMGGDTSGSSGYALPESVYRAAKPNDPRGPREVAAERLERLGIDRAVIDPGTAGSLSAIGNMDLAAALARATNDWQTAEWLDADDRYRGSIVVSPRDPQLAAAEVRRVAADDRFVQVLLAYPPELLGHRMLDPIFEAAAETGRPVALRSGGSFSGANKGLTGAGYPETSFEYELGTLYAAQPQLLSIVLGDAFERYPDLRLVFSGFGAAWLPSLLWRADREYRLQRVERPKRATRLPSEIVAEHVRLTTAPLELPEDGEQLATLLSLVDAERLLLFGSGELQDEPADLAALPEESRRLILGENAAALYRLSVPA